MQHMGRRGHGDLRPSSGNDVAWPSFVLGPRHSRRSRLCSLWSLAAPVGRCRLPLAPATVTRRAETRSADGPCSRGATGSVGDGEWRTGCREGSGSGLGEACQGRLGRGPDRLLGRAEGARRSHGVSSDPDRPERRTQPRSDYRSHCPLHLRIRSPVTRPDCHRSAVRQHGSCADSARPAARGSARPLRGRTPWRPPPGAHLPCPAPTAERATPPGRPPFLGRGCLKRARPPSWRGFRSGRRANPSRPPCRPD